jgi:hypothetical protein
MRFKELGRFKVYRDGARSCLARLLHLCNPASGQLEEMQAKASAQFSIPLPAASRTAAQLTILLRSVGCLEIGPETWDMVWKGDFSQLVKSAGSLEADGR